MTTVFSAWRQSDQSSLPHYLTNDLIIGERIMIGILLVVALVLVIVILAKRV
jgi:hypothetical protein